MNERKWHPVTGSAGFKPGIGRFERGEVIVMILASGIGLIVFRALAGLPFLLALGVAVAIPAGTAAFMLSFVTGKPRHHAFDMIEWQWTKLTCWLSNQGFEVQPKPLIEIESNDRKTD